MEKNSVFESDLKTIGLPNPYGQCNNNAISSTGRSKGHNFGTFSLFAGFEDGNVIDDIKDLTVSSPDETGIGRRYFPMDSFPHTSYPGMILLSESRRHSCGHCNKVFQSHQQLQQHDLVHSGERKYRCSYCDRAFKQLSHLQQHHRIHTGEKPYRCPLDGCDRAFPQLSNLQHHLRKHDKMVTPGHLCCVCGSSYPSEAVLRNHVLKIHHAETVSSHATVSGSTQSELLRHISTGSAPTTCSLQITPQNLHVTTHNQSAANCHEWYAIPQPKYAKLHENLQDPSLFGLNVVETPAQKTERYFQERKGPKCKSILDESNITKATCLDHIRQENKSHCKMEINRKLKRPLQVHPTRRIGHDIYSFNKSGLFDTGKAYCFPRRNIRDKLNMEITDSCANSSFSRNKKLLRMNNDSIHHILDGEINQEFESNIKTDRHTDLKYHNSNEHRATITKLEFNLALHASISGEENTVLCQNINNDFRKHNQADRMKNIAMQEQKQIICNRTCSVGVVGGASRSRKRKLTNPKRIYQSDQSTSQSLLSEVASFPNDLDSDVANESE
ncbi:hypothetical protein CHS0354_036587 [Potamilus streckersoni]|uniref:C2H2-type domain-containing protein n=1 Tax=Potamilus streckersoni TaxID=2493646 RepID=A0AAE0TJ90_9BIVA|nr:hypothetical protein CHS0354_036587 [Potamilus streckersoni]